MNTTERAEVDYISVKSMFCLATAAVLNTDSLQSLFGLLSLDEHQQRAAEIFAQLSGSCTKCVAAALAPYMLSYSTFKDINYLE